MGLYPSPFIAKLKDQGIAWFACATTLAEAREAERAGADVIVAQLAIASGLDERAPIAPIPPASATATAKLTGQEPAIGRLKDRYSQTIPLTKGHRSTSRALRV